MAIQPRDVDTDLLSALLAANNKLVLDGISTKFHISKMSSTLRPDSRDYAFSAYTIATADATDDATGFSLTNECKAYTDAHFTDALGKAHDTATSAVITMADGTDTATCVALANEIKAQFNTHRTASNVHYTADDTNTVTTADATDATDLLVLVNEIKEQLNDHSQDGPIGIYVDVVPA
jgi:hypothetical protein